MKKLMFFLILLLTGCSISIPQIPQDVLAAVQETNDTMFNLSGDIDAALERRLNSHLKDKKIGDTALIYINSNGGDVASAESIMNTMMSYKTICVADAAMSAAFEIFQHCTVRLYMNRSLLMVHHHWMVFNGPITAPELFIGGLDAYIQETSILTRCAMRMKITYADLFLKIQKNGGEWYLHGSDIIKYNAADYLVQDYQLKKAK